MPGKIVCVTITSPDLDASEALYTEALGYRTIAGGPVDGDLARSWQAPATEGARWLAMSPEGADDFCFRIIESPRQADYRPLVHHGWNAAELIVADVDELAPRVAAAGFEIIGSPEDLSFSDQIRAMQVLGPADEVLYLTMIKGPVPGLDLPQARCNVDRTFIAIVGGPDIEASKDYYHREHGVPEVPTIDSRVSVLANAFGLDREYRFKIAALPLGDQSFIETDQMPETARPRPVDAGMLPPAIAMVSFETGRTAATSVARVSGPPYYGRGSYCTTGPGGEIIELIYR